MQEELRVHGGLFLYLSFVRIGQVLQVFLDLIVLKDNIEEKEVDADASLTLGTSAKVTKKEKREKARKKKIEKLKEERLLFHLPSTQIGDKLVYGEGTRETSKQKSSNGAHKLMEVNPVLRKCSRALCSNYEKRPKEFKVCERCRSPYCGPECQVLDWQANHKVYCRQKNMGV